MTDASSVDELRTEAPPKVVAVDAIQVQVVKQRPTAATGGKYRRTVPPSVAELPKVDPEDQQSKADTSPTSERRTVMSTLGLPDLPKFEPFGEAKADKPPVQSKQLSSLDQQRMSPPNGVVDDAKSNTGHALRKLNSSTDFSKSVKNLSKMAGNGTELIPENAAHMSQMAGQVAGQGLQTASKAGGEMLKHGAGLLETGTDFASGSAVRFISCAVVTTMMIMVCVIFLAVNFWPECEAGKPCKWKKSQHEIFLDVVHDRVPAIREYADGRDLSYLGVEKQEGPYKPSNASRIAEAHSNASVANRDCVRWLVDGYKARVGDMTTQAEMVREILRTLRLENSTEMNEVVEDLLETSPGASFEPMLEQVATCARENLPLHATLCAWLDDPTLVPFLLEPANDVNNSEGLTFAFHELMVAERIAHAASYSRDFRNFLSTHYAGIGADVEAAIVQVSEAQGDSHEVIEGQLQKWNSIFMPTNEKMNMALSGASASKAVDAYHKEMIMNIIEATDVDRSLDVYPNADIGLTLAAAVPNFLPYDDEHHNLVSTYQKEWLDAYNVWYLNYAHNTMHMSFSTMMLMPSILCTSDREVRHHWLSSRSATLKSLFLTTVMESNERKQGLRVIAHRLAQRSDSARVAARHLELKAPEDCCDHGSIYQMFKKIMPYPTEIEMGSNVLRDEWFMVYFCVIAWLSVVFAGLGSEMVLGSLIMSFLVTNPNGFVAWHFAQLIFSLLLTIAFTSYDGVGLFFLPLGLWKMGFPETSAYLVNFLDDPRKLSLGALANLINGFSTLLHHLSTSLVITGVLLHVFPRNRPLTAGCLVPILQHLFILLKYHSKTGYLVVELGLEAWFQIEVLSNLHEFNSGWGLWIDDIGRGLGMCMLLAHYGYLLAAGLVLIRDVLCPEEVIELDDDLDDKCAGDEEFADMYKATGSMLGDEKKKNEERRQERRATTKKKFHRTLTKEEMFKQTHGRIGGLKPTRSGTNLKKS